MGTGDGRAVLASARREPTRLHLGLDASVEGLTAASTAAARKPSRGGAPNAWFVRASAEALPAELHHLADHVTVLLPWNSLLKAVVAPDTEVLHGLRSLARPEASLEVVVSLDERDGQEGLAAPSMARLALPYRAAGWRLRNVEELDRDALAAVGTTWAKRLAHGRPRRAWRLRAMAVGHADGS